MNLIKVIHDLPSNTLEATWAERIQLPDEWQDTPIKCHSYSIEQKDMFLADCAALGTPAEASDFADVCTAWLDESNNVNPFANLQQPPAPPISVTPWQIRKALNALDLRTAVETAMEGADQTTKDAWQYATEFVRTDPLVSAFGAVLGKTDEDLDALFDLAKTL